MAMKHTCRMCGKREVKTKGAACPSCRRSLPDKPQVTKAQPWVKRPRVGNVYYAADYQEAVMVRSIEARDSEYSRVLVERANGATTSNYPSYLLSRLKKSHFSDGRSH